MSTGQPKDSSPSEMSHLAVRSSMDACKGCRRFCSALIKALGQNRLASGIIITLPMLAMSCFLIYIETYFTDFLGAYTKLNIQIFEVYKNIIFSPIYTLAAITFAFGLLALLAIRCEYQNLLRFSAFVYRGIAHWTLLTTFLLLIPIGKYLPTGIVFQILMWSYLPAALWLFTAAVMTGHSDLLTAAIEAQARTVQQVDVVLANS